MLRMFNRMEEALTPGEKSPHGRGSQKSPDGEKRDQDWADK